MGDEIMETMRITLVLFLSLPLKRAKYSKLEVCRVARGLLKAG